MNSPRVRPRGRRQRVCVDCGRSEFVRSDNAAVQCHRCSSRLKGAKGNEARRRARPRRICEGCGSTFHTSPSGFRRYCTKTCRRESKRVRRQCAYCGHTFELLQSALCGKTHAAGRFCSRSCYHAHLCRTDRVHGRGSRWASIRREAIRRTPFCVLCGTTRRLDVHHITPYRLTRDNGQGNLIPVCKRCHKAVETIFVDLEPLVDDLTVTRLVLRSSLEEHRLATWMKLREIWSNLHV